MKIWFVHKQIEAPGIQSFFFKPELFLDYNAGQFVELILPINNSEPPRSERRWFTLSSSPSESLLAITTRTEQRPVSHFKRALYNLKPGEKITCSDAMGDFILPINPQIPILFVALGIGITPYRSMVRWLIDQKETRDISLLYGVSSLSEALFEDVFESYTMKRTILPSHTSTKNKMRIDADLIYADCPPEQNAQIYISGPEPLVEELTNSLKRFSYKPNQIITDYFSGYKNI